MSKILLNASGIAKTYTLWRQPSDRLLAPLLWRLGEIAPFAPRVQQWAWGKALEIARPFPALQCVNLTIKRGESLGIIGRNGSGKSTLLQILAGTLTPSAGTVERTGRLAALLELGTGFNLEFTGRENVFLQAGIYGIERDEMQRHFEEVAAFAEIGPFIDQPVKTYSSGMLVRLGFAVQVVLRPDLLIVDEALAVGDIFFQAKCAAYFRERLSEGMALIFVSHDLVAIKALCREAIVLHQGATRFHGDSKEAVSVFHDIHSQEARRSLNPTQTAPTPPQNLRNWDSADEIGNREAEIVRCDIFDETGQTRREFAEGETIRIRLKAVARTDVPVLHGSFQIVDRHRRALYGMSTLHREALPMAVAAGQSATLEVSFPGRLGAGEYLIDAALGWGDRGDGAFSYQAHRVGAIAAISIGRITAKPRFLGPVDLDAQLTWT